MTWDSTTVQAIAQAIRTGRLRMCTTCERQYAPDPSGRHRHRVLYGHTPSTGQDKEVTS